MLLRSMNYKEGLKNSKVGWTACSSPEDAGGYAINTHRVHSVPSKCL